jgi:hypothetical protein
MPGLVITHSGDGYRTPHNTMTLLDIANKVIANDEIGSVPVYGADAQWFVDQFQEVIRLHPGAEAWDEHKVYTAMCFLYLMDPEDFVG